MLLGSEFKLSFQLQHHNMYHEKWNRQFQLLVADKMVWMIFPWPTRPSFGEKEVSCCRFQIHVVISNVDANNSQGPIDTNDV